MKVTSLRRSSAIDQDGGHRLIAGEKSHTVNIGGIGHRCTQWSHGTSNRDVEVAPNGTVLV